MKSDVCPAIDLTTPLLFQERSSTHSNELNCMKRIYINRLIAVGPGLFLGVRLLLEKVSVGADKFQALIGSKTPAPATCLEKMV